MPQELAANANIVMWLVIGNIAILLILLYVGVRLFSAVGGMRGESKRADETARKLQREWEEYNETQSQDIRQKLEEIDRRAEELEKTTAGRIEEFEALVSRTRKEIERLEKYLRDVFEVELKNVFDSFDNTVTSVLGEMKGELMRGVDRIEEIESVMGSRNAVEGQLADSREAIEGLTAEEEEPEGPRTPEDALEVEGSTQEDEMLSDETQEDDEAASI